MKIIRGKIAYAKKIVIYGVEGIGKSTFAAQFPEPLFIDTEGGTKELDVARFEMPASWSMLLEEVRYVLENPGCCKTLVLDTADWAETLEIRDLCKEKGWSGLEDAGYGKGYQYSAERFGKLLNLLSDVVGKGIHVVIVAHAWMRKMDLPEEIGSYDHWEMKTSKKVAPLIREWADAVFFANYKVIVTNVDGKGAQKGKNKAQGSRRMMYTCHHACWDAKNRYGLPPEVPFEFDAIAHILQEARNPEESAARQPESAAPSTQSIPEFMQIEESDAEYVPFEEATQRKKTKENPKPAQKTGGSVPTGKTGSGPLARLRQLMEAKLVSEEELRWVVAQKGFFTQSTPMENYPEDFIEAWCIPNFDKIYAMLRSDLDKENPFTH